MSLYSKYSEELIEKSRSLRLIQQNTVQMKVHATIIINIWEPGLLSWYVTHNDLIITEIPKKNDHSVAEVKFISSYHPNVIVLINLFSLLSQARWTAAPARDDPQSGAGVAGEDDCYTGWKLWREMVRKTTIILWSLVHFTQRCRCSITHHLSSSLPPLGPCGCLRHRSWLFLWGATVSHTPSRSVCGEDLQSGTSADQVFSLSVVINLFVKSENHVAEIQS